MKDKLIEFIKSHKVILISIFVTFFIEIFICNYGFFRTAFLKNKDLVKNYEILENSNGVIIKNIDTRVTSINFKYKKPLTDKVTYTLRYTSSENSNKTEINPKIILANSPQYIHFDTHSNCQTIEIEFLTNSNLMIDEIILNHPNINVSFIRLIIIFSFVFFIVNLKVGALNKEQYNPDSKLQNVGFILILFIFCSCILIYTLCQYNDDKLFIEKENINKEDSVLMQAESMANGQIKLLEEPSKELKEMENPYDNIKREEQNVSYLYDVAYYNGNYYNYFGIAPIITSILPFRLITGGYLRTYVFNMFYSIIAIFALYSLYRKLIKKYIKKVSLCNFYLGFFGILFASNFLTLLRGLKYDIVQTSGIAFLLISLNLAISVFNNSRCKILKLILLGITTGLVVLSKPNLIVYYLLIVFFILIGMKELNLKDKIKNCILILIPLGILAIIQMILNYVRFDNILEFGAKYQLTGFNMTACMSFTFGKIYAGIVEYIFKTPTINPLRFPFVFINTDISHTSINEICYENRLIGLIAIPILYGYLLKRVILKKSENSELKGFINICLISSVLSIILNSCLGGICEAYSIDFKLILAIGAVILLLKALELNEKNEIIEKIFVILCITTILIMLPISLTTENNFLINFGSDTSVFFKNIFEFWG